MYHRMGHVKDTILGVCTKSVSGTGVPRDRTSSFGPNQGVGVRLKCRYASGPIFRNVIITREVCVPQRTRTTTLLVVRYGGRTIGTAMTHGGEIFRGGGSDSTVMAILSSYKLSISISNAGIRRARLMRCCYAS